MTTWARRRPRSSPFEIPTDKIGEVIGPKGKVINAIQEETGAAVMVDEDENGAKVSIAATDRAAVAAAEERVRAIVYPPEVELGRRVHRQGREHHRVRRVREHPAGA